MAITTNNGKLSVMEMDDMWEPALPLSPGALGTDDQRQLLWGFSDISWIAGGGSASTTGMQMIKRMHKRYK